MSHSDTSEKHQAEESLSCSEAKYQSSSELNYHAASDLKYQSTSDVKYQSTSDAEYHCPSDSKYQSTTDTKYQSVYVMSDQKDECIIATEVRINILIELLNKYDVMNIMRMRTYIKTHLIITFFSVL